MDTSIAPALFISSRTMFSTFFRTRTPVGSQVYNPEASLRIIPARSISWWLITSASAGVSFRVESRYWLVRMLLRFHFDDWNRLKHQPDTKKWFSLPVWQRCKKRGEQNYLGSRANTSKPAAVTRQRTLKSSSQTAYVFPASSSLR